MAVKLMNPVTEFQKKTNPKNHRILQYKTKQP